MNQDLAKLAELRASGAITDDQYRRLAQAAAQQGQGSSVGRQGAGAQPPSPVTGPSLLRVAGAAAGGAVAGTLAANLLQNALADPPPEVLAANIESTTTYTDTGYVTQSDVTWENADGEVVAEGTFTEEGVWADDTSQPADDSWASQPASYDDGSADLGGGFEF